MNRTRPTGFAAFTFIWVGQVLSLLGTGMTRFALGVWAWEATGRATPLTLVALASFGPGVILSPIAGALVDRWSRKLVLILSDVAAGLSTAVLLFLFATGQLEIWHIIVAGAFASAFESFQFPAYSAAVTMMIDKEQYARASGMMSIAEAASGILAPIFAGLLIGLGASQLGSMDAGIQIIMAIDLLAMGLAVGVLLMAHIPQPIRHDTPIPGVAGIISEVGYGFDYILKRPSLLGLQLVFFFINLTATFGFVVLTPMILARTNTDAGALSLVEFAAGIGGLVGGLLLSVWGGPKRKTNGVLGGMLLESLLGPIVTGLSRSLPFWMLGAFFSAFFIPIINGSNQAIWQSKVAPDVQGRVFATRRWIAQITIPIAMLMAGPLADRVFEPALQPGGRFFYTLGSIVGTGPGAGMSVMFLIAGALGILVAIGGYLFPAVRNAESILPDADKVAEEGSEAGHAAPGVEPTPEPAS
jgi:MFS family permease